MPPLAPHMMMAQTAQVLAQRMMVQADRIACVFDGDRAVAKAQDPIPGLSGGMMLGGVFAQDQSHGIGQQSKHQMLFTGERLARVKQRVVAMMQRLLGAALGGFFWSHRAPLRRRIARHRASYASQ